MAAAPTFRPVVLAIIERRSGSLCLDIFRHADGTFGFQEYRRDPEHLGGWTLVDRTADGVYLTRAAALQAAQRHVPWLAAELKSRDRQ